MTHRINRTPVQKEEHEIHYGVRCTCRTTDEATIRLSQLRCRMTGPRERKGVSVTANSREVVAAVDAEDASIATTGELVHAT